MQDSNTVRAAGACAPMPSGPEAFFAWFDRNIERQDRARAVIDAVLNCYPEDRLFFIEIIHEALSPGWPMPGSDFLMAEAREWARIASTEQLKAWLVACFEALPDRDQDAFLGYLEEMAAE